MGDLVSKEGGEGRGWPLFAASDPPEGSLSSLYLPYPATLRPTLSIATPPLHQTTPLPFRNPRSTSLCALVNLSNYPLPLSYLVCLAASNTNQDRASPLATFSPPRCLLPFPSAPCSKGALSTLFLSIFFFFRFKWFWGMVFPRGGIFVYSYIGIFFRLLIYPYAINCIIFPRICFTV